MIKRTYEEVIKSKIQREEIFKPIKSLDVEIRTITEELQTTFKEVYYIVDVGFCESLGEKGFIYSFYYDNIPTEEEILKDVKEYIKEQIIELKENYLKTAYEEEQLKALLKINKEVLK